MVPLPPQKGSYYPEDAGAAHRPQAPGHHPARQGRASPSRATSSAGSAGRSGCPWTRSKGWCCAPSATRTRGGCARSSTGPSVSEMVVPYGDARPHARAGRTPSTSASGGSGGWPTPSRSGATAWARSTTSTPTTPTSGASPTRCANAICMHEEDYGILWKHVDLHTGRTEVRRSRRLVVSSIATVGNYEYGFYWYFYLDGTDPARGEAHRHHVDPGAWRPGAEPDHASMVAPQLAAPYHQHLFNVRLDMEVDGPAQRRLRGGEQARSARGRQPLGERLRGGGRPCSRPSWPPNGWSTRPPAVTGRIVNRSAPNAPRPADRLQAGAGLDAHPAGRPGLERGPAGPLRHQEPLGHPLRPGRAAGGRRPPQPARGRQTACPAGRRPTGRSSTRDVVVWHTFGVTHIPRPEDWPVMPVEYTGFSLLPVGFFDAQPGPRRPGLGRGPLPRRLTRPLRRGSATWPTPWWWAIAPARVHRPGALDVAGGEVALGRAGGGGAARRRRGAGPGRAGAARDGQPPRPHPDDPRAGGGRRPAARRAGWPRRSGPSRPSSPTTTCGGGCCSGRPSCSANGVTTTCEQYLHGRDRGRGGPRVGDPLRADPGRLRGRRALVGLAARPGGGRVGARRLRRPRRSDVRRARAPRRLHGVGRGAGGHRRARPSGSGPR